MMGILGLMMIISFVMWPIIYVMVIFTSFFFFFFFFSELDEWFFSYIFFIDLLGWCMVILSLWIGGLMLIASYNVIVFFGGALFSYLLIILIFFLLLTFMVHDYMMFYIFFEGSLIPIFLLILGWGYQPERLQAGIYMLFYTLFGSLPLLLSFMNFDNLMMSMSYMLSDYNIVSFFIFFCTIFGFLIKMPMFMVHLWLPSAHVEAPISGSMMLAGVLLKLGGYGLMRTMKFFKLVLVNFSFCFISLSLFSFIYISLMCLRQYDLSALIAYSSVAHMSLVICGLMMCGVWGYSGSLIMMLGHGLCSSGLFCLANVVYERLGSRSIVINKGLLLLFPGMGLWWFLLCICNMAAPPSLNLVGELSLMMSIVGWEGCLGIILFLGSFFSGCYTIYMYSATQHGGGLYTYSLYDCKVREYLLMLLHWFPLNFMILKMDFFI
uniref:NADH-ubiquinone oxidoreductase chain 4 n=1 Tax=Scolopendra dehaani TaxID=2609776 RepID=A0A343JMK7_SCODE|nr:NAHD dehydrogenase subunit 4 [Scolopendra dehaani]